MQHLLLLHGAIGSKEQLQPLAEKLKSNYNVHQINFSGHGDRPFPSQPFSIKLFAEDVISWMDEKKIDQTNIFGYSMGGYVALYLAKHFPQRVNRIITLATKLAWNPEIAGKEVKQLDPKKIKEKIPAFSEVLKQRHHPNSWELVLSETSKMMISLGEKNSLSNEDFSSINHMVLLSIGDRDTMVTIEETIAVYRKLKNANLLVLPDAVHPIEKVPLERLTSEINSFLKKINS